MATSPTAAPALRVLTMNTLAPAYVDYGPRREVLRAGLRRLAPDVAALQEVEAEQVEDLLGGGHHVVRHRSTDPDDPVGAALATRWAPTAVHHLDLRTGPRTAVLPWTGAVVVDHEAERERQALAVARFVEDLVAGRAAHVVLLGDLDATPDAASVRFLTGRQSRDGTRVAYHDAWESAHGDAPGHTFTPVNPLARDGSMPLVRPRRIDYVLVRGEDHGPTLRVRSCELVLPGPVGGVRASDHHGLVADLEVPERPPGRLV